MKTATQEQLAALTVPATLPGVVQRCTPVRFRGVHRVVSHVEPERLWLGNEWQPHRLLDIDLTNATGRSHVDWAIAAKVAGNTFRFREHTYIFTRVLVAGKRGWTLTCGGHPGLRWPEDNPIFKGLDWHDRTTLPDGSLFVDALARKAVALHVLGGAA